jgi:hypothetical protein
MIVNLLRLTLRDDITDDERAQVLEALRRTASLESVSFSTVGEEFGDPTGRVIDYVVGIADIEALQRICTIQYIWPATTSSCRGCHTDRLFGSPARRSAIRSMPSPRPRRRSIPNGAGALRRYSGSEPSPTIGASVARANQRVAGTQAARLLQTSQDLGCRHGTIVRALPVVPSYVAARQSRLSRSITCATNASMSAPVVSSVKSGFSGASYGASMPVSPLS